MIGVDWGTTNFRAFRITPGGAIRDQRAGPRGIVNVPNNRFSDTLREEIGPWLAVGETHVLLSVMIEALADEWDPEKYKDSFQENLKQLIETKLEGGEVAAVEKPKKLAPVVDLMAALKQSLAQMEGKKKPAATIKTDEPAAANAKSRRR